MFISPLFMVGRVPKFLLLSLFQQGSSQGTHMPSRQREWAILPNVPVTLEQQPMISFSREPRGPSVRPKR